MHNQEGEIYFPFFFSPSEQTTEEVAPWETFFTVDFLTIGERCLLA